MSTKLSRRVCPLCSNGELTATPIGPGLWRMECPPRRHHPGGEAYAWETTEASEQELEEVGGITEELGLYDDLPLCLASGEPWVEYGAVEHRYKVLRPAVYQKLVERYSHTKHGPKPYTASAFIASALKRLADRGDLLVQTGLPATGYWAYNGSISDWARPPADPGNVALTWAEFAEAQDLDPDDWVLDPGPADPALMGVDVHEIVAWVFVLGGLGYIVALLARPANRPWAKWMLWIALLWAWRESPAWLLVFAPLLAALEYRDFVDGLEGRTTS